MDVIKSISIHALREEGDQMACVLHNSADQISIHALREEGDEFWAMSFRSDIEFLSTPSARRATFYAVFGSNRTADFYPRPPRGGRP